MKSPCSIVFIDSAVEDTQVLVTSVAAGCEVILLDQQRDGLGQITEILGDRAAIASVHIVCQGSPGGLYLGNAQLHPDNLDGYASDLQQWAAALRSACLQGTSPVRVYFYGCDAASGEMGAALANRLSQLTGAAVATPAKAADSADLDPDWGSVFSIDRDRASGSFCTIPALALTFDAKVRASDCCAAIGTVRYWTGAGEDNKWSNPLNWSDRAVPAPGDDVVFDGRCSKDALLDICPQIKSLTVAADYTGTLSGWNELLAIANISIQGGTINVNLEAGGDLTVENGTVSSYLQVKGNLTIDSGTVTWYGGKVAGDTHLTGGTVSFSSNYDSYYIFEGNFTRSGGSVEGMPIFGFYGSDSQSFNPGTDGMLLRDLYNNFELILDGDVTVSSLFFNSGSLTVVPGAVLDARLATSFSNSGTIIEQGKILRGTKAIAKPEADGNPVTLNTSSNPSDILELDEDQTFDGKATQTTQATLKSLTAFNEVS